MSIFDKDLVERSIDYFDDPEENVARQIARELERLSRYVKNDPSFTYKESVKYVEAEIDLFMDTLLHGHRPPTYIGTYKQISGYDVKIDQNGCIPTIKVRYQIYGGDIKEISFIIGFPYAW